MSSPAVTEALMLQHRRSWNVEQQVAKLTTDRVETGSLDMLRGSLNVLQNRCKAGDRDDRSKFGPRSSESYAEASLDPKCAAVQAAKALGVSVVVAAGHSGVDVNTRSPAHLDDAIAVAANNVNKQLACFSWFCTGADEFAPGHKVNPTIIACNSDYAEHSGISMSTSHVACVLALRLQHNRGWSAEQQVDELTTDCVATGSLKVDVHYGKASRPELCENGRQRGAGSDAVVARVPAEVPLEPCWHQGVRPWAVDPYKTDVTDSGVQGLMQCLPESLPKFILSATSPSMAIATSGLRITTLSPRCAASTRC